MPYILIKESTINSGQETTRDSDLLATPYTFALCNSIVSAIYGKVKKEEIQVDIRFDRQINWNHSAVDLFVICVEVTLSAFSICFALTQSVRYYFVAELKELKFDK